MKKKLAMPPVYRSPLGTRYASATMSLFWSEAHKAERWREIWIILADEQRKLGLPITQKQIRSLKAVKHKINLQRVRDWELKLKHDVMSHLKHFGELAKSAEPILHLGATSAFITDNAEALILRESVELILQKLLVILETLNRQMLKFSDLEMTGYTHFQPAQPVTLGKRMGLWAQDLLWDYQELSHVLDRYEPLGCKGTTGTQASFMVLFKNDYKKVSALDRNVCRAMGFDRAVSLSGQTLSRKLDVWFLQALSNLAASFSKMSYDLRLLQHTGEVKEPFGREQVGSSAMPYKQNPMLAERISGLARFLMTLSQNAPWTHAVQWLERSLDDSSNRRLSLPESFLTADALCEAAYKLVSGLRVDEKLIARNLSKHRAAFETEAQMMEETLRGGSRQEAHERIRKQMLAGSIGESQSNQRLSGAASLQVREFSKSVLTPFIRREQKSRSGGEEFFKQESL